MKKEPIVIKIRDFRQEKDLTQSALADALGISRQSVIAIESGRYLPSLPLACEIAKFFDIALDDLFNFSDHFLFQESENPDRQIGNEAIQKSADLSAVVSTKAEGANQSGTKYPERHSGIPHVVSHKLVGSLSLTTNKEDNMKYHALSPWSPLREMRSLQEEMDRLFEEGVPTVERSVSLPSMPSANLRQDENNIYLEMPVPGYKEENIDIDVAPEYVSISGKVIEDDEEKKKGYFRQEYACQSFSRTVPFPVPVDSDKAEADVEKGMLLITVPKVEPEKPKTKKLVIKKK